MSQNSQSILDRLDAIRDDGFDLSAAQYVQYALLREMPDCTSNIDCVGDHTYVWLAHEAADISIAVDVYDGVFDEDKESLEEDSSWMSDPDKDVYPDVRYRPVDCNVTPFKGQYQSSHYESVERAVGAMKDSIAAYESDLRRQQREEARFFRVDID